MYKIHTFPGGLEIWVTEVPNGRTSYINNTLGALGVIEMEIVDKDGKRFSSETLKAHELTAEDLCALCNPKRVGEKVLPHLSLGTTTVVHAARHGMDGAEGNLITFLLVPK